MGCWPRSGAIPGEKWQLKRGARTLFYGRDPDSRTTFSRLDQPDTSPNPRSSLANHIPGNHRSDKQSLLDSGPPIRVQKNTHDARRRGNSGLVRMWMRFPFIHFACLSHLVVFEYGKCL